MTPRVDEPTDDATSATTRADESEEDAAARRLGARIREVRQLRGLTLVRLARATELSHPFLSQLERGLAQPSLGSLRRIALALQTSPIELITAAEEPDARLSPVEIRRAGEGAVPDGFAAGSARMLAHGHRPFHAMEVESDAAAPGDDFVHDEDELLYVVAGAVVIELAGEAHELEPGDSAYYRGGTVHRWWSADGGAYRLLVVKQGPRPAARGATPDPA